MNKDKNPNTYVSTIIVIVIAILIGFVILRNHSKNNDTTTTTNTNTDTSIPVVHEGWKTSVNNDSDISFMFPEDLGTKYIMPVDWPPSLNTSTEIYDCTEAGTEIAPAGKTSEVTFAGHKYCVTKESEGAAGSIYTNYAYVRATDTGEQILTFSLRSTQCGNYDEPQMDECNTERESFDITPTVDQIFETFVQN